jgi:hypothetical protein
MKSNQKKLKQSHKIGLKMLDWIKAAGPVQERVGSNRTGPARVNKTSLVKLLLLLKKMTASLPSSSSYMFSFHKITFLMHQNSFHLTHHSQDKHIQTYLLLFKQTHVNKKNSTRENF